MRTMSLVAVLGLAIGCTGQQLQLDREGGIATNARGVALVGDGLAQVGMSGTTCEVTTGSGMVGTDYDYPGDDDRVVDAGTNGNGGGVVVVTSDKGVHIQEQDDWFWASSTDYDVPDVTDAVLLDDGDVVVLSKTPGGCVIQQLGDRPASTNVDASVCNGPVSMGADPGTGSVVIGSGSGVITVLPGSVPQTISEEPAELVAFDKRALVVYAASYGDSILEARERDGSIRWSVDVGGGILDVATLGDRGMALVSVAYSDGSGALRAFNGADGVEVLDQALFAPADEVVASADGQSVATVRPGQVDFFQVGTVWSSIADYALEAGEIEVDW